MSSKNTSPLAGRVCFLASSPCCSSDTASSARCSRVHAFPVHTWRSFGFALSANKQLGSSMANHGSIGGSRLGAALWLCWVVRGSIWWPMRLIRLSRPGYLPSNPCAQHLYLRTSGLPLPDFVVSALMLLVASDVRLRTSLLSSTGSVQSPPSCEPASAAPWPAAFRWRFGFHRTRGTDRPSRSPSWQRS